MDFETLLARYADLIVTHGLNVQSGQIVNIVSEACHRELAFLIAKQCYSKGAAFVNIDLTEPRLHRERILNSTLERMQYAPPFLSAKYDEIVESKGANMRIVGPEDPDLLVGLDPKKINAARVAQYQRVKRFYEEGIEKSRVHWNLAAASSRGWAKRIFPKLSADEAQVRLWGEIFRICRVDREDYLEEWRRHDRVLQERSRRLTDLAIDSLRFSGPGTDLTVGFSEKALFKGGTDQGPYGARFEPNIPSEECFTTPDWRRTSGHVSTTRPFFINGTLIKGLSLRFEGGEIIDFSAEQGAEVFREYIDSDEGGKRLGEVALVGIDSPIYRSGLVFEEILFDENAACHIAVGSSYKFCLAGGDSLSKEELQQIGANESSVHTDMMISSDQVDVTAHTRAGERVVLIEHGEWKKF